MLELLLKKFEKYRKTSPITSVVNHSVTFIRDSSYLHHLKTIKEDIWLIAPTFLQNEIRKYQEAFCPTVNIHYTDWPEFEFTIFHNRVNERKRKTLPSIGDECKIHKSVVLDADGLKVVNGPNGSKIQFFHTGHIIIGDRVEIGPLTVIHRSLMGVTSIGSDCKIGSRNIITHDCKIGRDNIIDCGVIFNRGVITGVNCWFASGSIIRHYVNICDDVLIGMGSLVLKNIEKSGIYFGSPCKYVKEVGLHDF